MYMEYMDYRKKKLKKAKKSADPAHAPGVMDAVRGNIRRGKDEIFCFIIKKKL